MGRLWANAFEGSLSYVKAERKMRKKMCGETQVIKHDPRRL